MRGRYGLRYLWVPVAAIFLSGCVIFKIPVETVKTVGMVVKATGAVAGAVGGGVVATARTAEKCVSVGGHIIETAIQAKAAKSIITAVAMP